LMDTVKTLSDMENQIRSQFNIRIRKGFIRRPIQLDGGSSQEEEIADPIPRQHDLTAVLENVDPNISSVLTSERSVEKQYKSEKPKVSKPRTVIPIGQIRNFSANDEKRHHGASLISKDLGGGQEPIERRSFIFKHDI
jgi:hypothetical protein